jgi:diguanylate cyclase (GGDEF)-like protein
MLQSLKALLHTVWPANRTAAAPLPAVRPAVLRADDTLTGLPDRRAFSKQMALMRRQGRPFVLALIDIDHFKVINHEHGHELGDEILREFAIRMRAVAAPEVLLARTGGDEYAALIPGGLEQGSRQVDSILAAVRLPLKLSNGMQMALSASAGLAPVTGPGYEEETLKAADTALYAAKNRGRDQYLVFDDDVSGVVSARRELAAAVSVLQERNRELQHLVQTDALTGLRNRHALDQVLPIGVGIGAWQQCSVAFLDIDHFGDYNHLHGDGEGDQVLRQVAATIRAVARHGDMVFRKGGEEIVVVLPETNAEDARSAAERMRQAVQALEIPHSGSAVAPVITVTVGIASACAGQPATVEQLMANAADLAMQAKVKNLRNCVHARR